MTLIQQALRSSRAGGNILSLILSLGFAAIDAVVDLPFIIFRSFRRNRNCFVNSNTIAITALVKLLETTTNEFIQWKTAKSLGTIGRENKIAIAALVKVLETTTNELIQWQAAKSLGTIGRGNKIAIAALVKLLETTTNEFIQWQALEYLRQIGTYKLIATQIIVSFFHGNIFHSTKLLVSNIKILNNINNLIWLFLVKIGFSRAIKRNASKNLFYKSVINCLDIMQEERDITIRRYLINSCLQLHQQIVEFSLNNANFHLVFTYTEIFRNRYIVERIAQQDTAFPKTIAPELTQQINRAKQKERTTRTTLQS